MLQKKFGDLVTDGDTALLTKLVNSIVHNPVKYAKARHPALSFAVLQSAHPSLHEAGGRRCV